MQSESPAVGLAAVLVLIASIAVIVASEEEALSPPLQATERGPALPPPAPTRAPVSDQVDVISCLPAPELEGCRYCGGRATPERAGAVHRALVWLKRHQTKAGLWSAAEPECCASDSPGEQGQRAERPDLAVSSLALLAFLGEGNTHRFGPHKRVVNKGLWAIKRLQGSGGELGGSGDPESVYDHAYATRVLCEAYAMSRDFTLKRYARQALSWILRAQNSDGGWSFSVSGGQAGEPSNASVTGAMTFALIAGHEAGLEVPAQAVERTLAWFEGEPGPYQAGRVLSLLPSDTAVGVFARLYGGGGREAALRRSVQLTHELPRWGPDEERVDLDYWYLGSLAMYQVGGEGWSVWRAALHEALLPRQRAGEGEPCPGSWAPRGGSGLFGGRSASTALAVLALQAPDRFRRH